jgi:hypothetical protein
MTALAMLAVDVELQPALAREPAQPLDQLVPGHPACAPLVLAE